MTKLISARTIGTLVVMGLVLALSLVSCSLPRINRGGDAGEFVPPTIVIVPQQEEAAPAGPTPGAPAPGAPPQAQAVQEGAVLRSEPLSRQIEVGQTVVVDIIVQDVTDLSAADVQLQFDPAIFQAEDAQPGEEGVQVEPGPFLSPDFVVVNNINNQTGLAHYAVTQVAPTPPVAGTGVLARIVFRAQAQGVGSFTFALTNLATSAGQVIPVTVQAGEVVVGQPLVTPTPTQTLVPGQPTPTDTPVIIVPATQTPVPLPATPTHTPAPPPVPTATPGPTPVPPLTALPPGAIVGSCYRVQAGDTLVSIAHKFGVNPHRLAAVNKLFSPDLVYVNQGLFIPDPASSGVYGPKVYIARDGDTLDKVGFQCNLPTEFLADVNHLPEDAALQAGHVLIIPIPPPFPAKPPVCCPPPPPPCCPPPPPPPCYGQRCY